MEKKSVFETLNHINVNDYVEKKNGLTYLSWSFALTELLKNYPDATYKVYENADGWNYHTDGRTAWVKVSVTIEGKENVEYLPIMDFKNKSIPLENVTSMDVNKAIQRGLTKAIARHGLGLYIYAGEDIPQPPLISEEQVNEIIDLCSQVSPTALASLEEQVGKSLGSWDSDTASVKIKALKKKVG